MERIDSVVSRVFAGLCNPFDCFGLGGVEGAQSLDVPRANEKGDRLAVAKDLDALIAEAGTVHQLAQRFTSANDPNSFGRIGFVPICLAFRVGGHSLHSLVMVAPMRTHPNAAYDT